MSYIFLLNSSLSFEKLTQEHCHQPYYQILVSTFLKFPLAAVLSPPTIYTTPPPFSILLVSRQFSRGSIDPRGLTSRDSDWRAKSQDALWLAEPRLQVQGQTWGGAEMQSRKWGFQHSTPGLFNLMYSRPAFLSRRDCGRLLRIRRWFEKD